MSIYTPSPLGSSYPNKNQKDSLLSPSPLLPPSLSKLLGYLPYCFGLLILCSCGKKTPEDSSHAKTTSTPKIKQKKTKGPSKPPMAFSSQEDGLQRRENALFQKLQESFKNQAKIDVNFLMGLIEKGRLEQAEKIIKKALFDDYSNSFLHLLNGLIYQQSSGRKALARRKLAQSALKMACNSSVGQRYHWIYLYFYALDALNFKDYNTAKDLLVQALLLSPDEPLLLYAMAYSAYGSGDFLLARDVINKALTLDPHNISFLRSAILIYAALGETQEAMTLLEIYKKQKKSSLGKNNDLLLDNRNHEEDFSQLIHWIQRGKLKQGLWQQANAGDISGDSDNDLTQFLQGALTDGKEEEPPTSSGVPLLFEVIMLKAAESKSYMSGINIISRLNALFSLTNEINRKFNFINGFAKGWNLTNTLTRKFGIPDLSYTLNLVNQSNSTIWISSNSVVQAMVGKQSFFVAGQQFTGSSGSGITGGTMTTVDIGSKIELTPRMITKDGMVLVDISVTTSAFDRATPNVDQSISSQVIPVTGSNIQTTVKVRLGETIMLAALVSETKSQNYSGIPYIMRIFPFSLFTSQQLQASEKRYMVFLIKPKLMNKDESFDQWCGHERTLATIPGAIRQRLLDSGIIQEGTSCLSCVQKAYGQTTSVVVGSSNVYPRPYHPKVGAPKPGGVHSKAARWNKTPFPQELATCDTSPKRARNIEGLSPCAITKETLDVMNELGFYDNPSQTKSCA